MASEILYAVWRLISVTRDVDQGESHQLRRVLCAYANKYADPETEIPDDVVEVTQHLTEQERKNLTVLGEIRAELLSIEAALEAEFAALDQQAKDILLANAKQGTESLEPFSQSMSLLERLLWGAAAGASTGWDMYLGFEGPDQSLLPRSSGYAVTTISGAIGFLASPTANRMQFLETIFMDRAVFGTPHRSFYTAGIEHESFYKNKTPYLIGVSNAAAVIVLGWTLPSSIRKKVDERTMSKIGARSVPDDQLVVHAAMKVDAKAKADTLMHLEAKLEGVAARWVSGDGTDDQIARIRSITNRQAELLLRVTNQYVVKRHAEHLKKAGYMGLWNSTIGGILYAARRNLGQIGVLVPYIVHAQRSMWEVFFDFTQGAEAMRKLYVRLGAPIFYQLWCISVPLLKRGAAAFNDSTLKKKITAILVTINVTVIRHTPLIVDGVAAFGAWLFSCGRRSSAGAASAISETSTPVEGEEADEVVGSSPEAVSLVSELLEERNAMEAEPYVGDGQYLIDFTSELEEDEIHL
jgi:hypothetical protein